MNVINFTPLSVFIGLGYIDHSRYGIVYNPLEQSNSNLEDNDEKQMLGAPCTEFGGG